MRKILRFAVKMFKITALCQDTPLRLFQRVNDDLNAVPVQSETAGIPLERNGKSFKSKGQFCLIETAGSHGRRGLECWIERVQ